MNQKKLTKELANLGVTRNHADGTLEYIVDLKTDYANNNTFNELAAKIGLDVFKHNAIDNIQIKISNQYKNCLALALHNYGSESSMNNAQEEVNAFSKDIVYSLPVAAFSTYLTFLATKAGQMVGLATGQMFDSTDAIKYAETGGWVAGVGVGLGIAYYGIKTAIDTRKEAKTIKSRIGAKRVSSQAQLYSI
jgi:hypothetical protein